jgi:hypothetical protein
MRKRGEGKAECGKRKERERGEGRERKGGEEGRDC